MHDDLELQRKFASLLPNLDERQRRLLAAAEARSLGYGGIRRVSRASGISHTAIRRALKQLDAPPPPAGQVRRPGGGRKKVRDNRPRDAGRSDVPAAVDLQEHPSTGRGPGPTGIRRQPPRRRRVAPPPRLQPPGQRQDAGGKQSPDRDAQFRYISEASGRYLAAGWPVISVDTKKKELIGDFKNAGREWQPQGHPQEVQVHDFPDPRIGKAIPYGVYDLGWDVGWVNVGVDHDTASFAVEGIRQWWSGMGEEMYAEAGHLLICAAGGGSNGYRVRLWKVELQAFADES